VFRRRFFATAFVLASVFCNHALATVIEYDLEDTGGNTWRYNYYVTNDTLGESLDEFTVYFDVGLFADLSIGDAPLSWDPIVIEPDPNLPHAGFYDALALVAGIAPGETLGGFWVQFSWLGAGSPGSQLFDVVNANFETIDSGITRLRVTDPGPPVGVPEPGSLGLLAVALVMMLWFRSQRRVARQE
jgi:hypothetical protein